MTSNLWEASKARFVTTAAGLLLWPLLGFGIEKKIVLDSQTEVTAEEDKQSATNSRPRVSIRWIGVDNSDESEEAKDTAWLGISTTETAEEVASQLQLKPGAGLQIIYVAPNSSAAKAGLQKHDVLVNFGDQLLVHPGQLRKLVQTHKQGDAIKIEYYRAGKKDVATAILGKIPEKYAWSSDDKVFRGNMEQLTKELAARKATEAQHQNLHDAFMAVKLDHDKLQEELHSGMDQVRKTIQEAALTATNLDVALEPVRRALREIAGSGVVLDNKATVTIRSAGKDSSSIVTADNSGTIVLFNNPKLHLTAHDKENHLLFDGQIETPEERAKVPKELWQRVEPLISKLGEDQKQ